MPGFEVQLSKLIMLYLNFNVKNLPCFPRHQSAEKEEFEHQQKELEKVCNPIMTKLYQSAGGMPGGMPGGFSGAGGAPGAGESSSGPTIEEVD